jgi:hypothetical protein
MNKGCVSGKVCSENTGEKGAAGLLNLLLRSPQ